MQTKNKKTRVRPDTDVARKNPAPGKKTNDNNDATGAHGQSNAIHIDENRRTGQLHIKSSVSGSDSDGQAE